LSVEEEEVRSIARIAEADLAQALPALEAATSALEAVSKKGTLRIASSLTDRFTRD
jgi:dynein heavy chain